LASDDADTLADLRIPADPDQLQRVRKALMSAATGVGFNAEDAGQICLAIDEALANVIKHGYGGACDRPIDMCIRRLEDGERCGIHVSIRDFGRQVDPSDICGRDLDDVRPGGLGVHIMRSVMDEVEYERAAEGGMRVAMTKWVR